MGKPVYNKISSGEETKRLDTRSSKFSESKKKARPTQKKNIPHLEHYMRYKIENLAKHALALKLPKLFIHPRA
jgi:hypothetical protein